MTEVVVPAAVVEAPANAAAAGSAAVVPPVVPVVAAAAVAPATPATPATTGVVPMVPEQYALTIPEGSLLAPAALERATAAAKALKVTADADAQALVGLLDDEAKEIVATYEAARAPGGAVHTAVVAEYQKAALAHPALGNGNADTLAQKATAASILLNRYPSGRALLADLNASGEAHNPKILLLLNDIYASFGEKELVQPGTLKAPETASLATRFFGEGVKDMTAVAVK